MKDEKAELIKQQVRLNALKNYEVSPMPAESTKIEVIQNDKPGPDGAFVLPKPKKSILKKANLSDNSKKKVGKLNFAFDIEDEVLKHSLKNGHLSNVNGDINGHVPNGYIGNGVSKLHINVKNVSSEDAISKLIESDKKSDLEIVKKPKAKVRIFVS